MGSNPFPNQTVATVDSSTMAPYSSTSPRQQRRWRRLLRAFLLYSHCAVTCTVQSLHSAVTVQSLHSAVTVQSAVARLTIAQSLYSRCTAQYCHLIVHCLYCAVTATHSSALSDEPLPATAPVPAETRVSVPPNASRAPVSALGTAHSRCCAANAPARELSYHFGFLGGDCQRLKCREPASGAVAANRRE